MTDKESGEKLEIKWLDIRKIFPYEKNPRKNDQAVDKVAKSIETFGFNQPIVVDSENTIVVGHTRWKAANKLGLEYVPTLVLAETMSKEKIQAYRIADNKLNELAEWDDELLIEELKDLQSSMGNVELTGFDEDYVNKESLEDHEKYTKKIDTPIYTPTGKQPETQELYEDHRTKELLENIDKAECEDIVKDFLRLAAHRHTKFNYKLIAEYYAHAPKDVQKLMEDSALVIIDFERAIELGYAKLRDDIADIYKQAVEEEDVN